MISRFVIRLLALVGIVAAGGSAAQAQQVDCRFFKVTAENLSVYTEPRGDSSFLGALNRDDFVCVAGDQQVGDRKWAYVAYRLLGGGDQRKTLDGWGIMSALAPASQDEVAALRNSPARPPETALIPPPPPPPPAAFNAPPPTAFVPPPPPREEMPPREAMPPGPGPGPGEAASSDEIVRYSQKLTSGGYPVQGFSLEELVRGIPEFPPIEGLPDDVWHKTCNNCHQWNQQSLCVQARIYAQDEKMAFRKKHPYGGPEKIAMMKWARQGCQ
jgi:hypothetical protein